MSSERKQASLRMGGLWESRGGDGAARTGREGETKKEKKDLNISRRPIAN